MNSEPLTDEVSKRICNHMNKDHKDAVISYAIHYGELQNPIEATMLAISPLSMRLAVDGIEIEIPFDHRLVDSVDAHKTLVAMIGEVAKRP